MILTSISLMLPDWCNGILREKPAEIFSPEDRMRFVIELARQNVSRGTGGPFGAAVFTDSGLLISMGVNLVTTMNCSIFHAEVIALILAQQSLGRYDLSNGGTEHLELVASAEPCAMCLGAIPWSGVCRLVCGARDEDIRSIGFDEGKKPEGWIRGLEDRGIVVKRDMLRRDAVVVLKDYLAAGGEIYNAVRPPSGC